MKNNIFFNLLNYPDIINLQISKYLDHDDTIKYI
jgi:hypothetical protein